MAGIDEPERGQPFGKKSKEYLSSLVAGEDVQVDWCKRDRYQRIVGKIIHDEKDVNLEMLRSGYAWWSRKCSGEQSPVDQVLYADAEEKAGVGKVGLWSEPNPVPPWAWWRK